jgi:hypothetical protein
VTLTGEGLEENAEEIGGSGIDGSLFVDIVWFELVASQTSFYRSRLV